MSRPRWCSSTSSSIHASCPPERVARFGRFREPSRPSATRAQRSRRVARCGDGDGDGLEEGRRGKGGGGAPLFSPADAGSTGTGSTVCFVHLSARAAPRPAASRRRSGNRHLRDVGKPLTMTFRWLITPRRARGRAHRSSRAVGVRRRARGLARAMAPRPAGSRRAAPAPSSDVVVVRAARPRGPRGVTARLGGLPAGLPRPPPPRLPRPPPLAPPPEPPPTAPLCVARDALERVLDRVRRRASVANGSVRGRGRVGAEAHEWRLGPRARERRARATQTRPRYEWVSGEWGACNAACGGFGVQRRGVHCRAMIRGAPPLARRPGAAGASSRTPPASRTTPPPRSPTGSARAAWSGARTTTGPRSRGGRCDKPCGGGERAKRHVRAARDLWDDDRAHEARGRERHRVAAEDGAGGGGAGAGDDARSTVRGIANHSQCEAYADFIGAAPAPTGAVTQRAPPRRGGSSGNGATRRRATQPAAAAPSRARCGASAAGSGARRRRADESECPSRRRSLRCRAEPKMRFLRPDPDGSPETCSYRGSCDAEAQACDCEPTMVGEYCDVARTCGFDRLMATDGTCCAGAVDAVGLCCPTETSDARLDGDGVCCFSASSTRAGRATGSRPRWTRGVCAARGPWTRGGSAARRASSTSAALRRGRDSCPVARAPRGDAAERRGRGDDAMAEHLATWAVSALNLSSVVNLDGAASEADLRAMVEGAAATPTRASRRRSSRRRRRGRGRRLRPRRPRRGARRRPRRPRRRGPPAAAAAAAASGAEAEEEALLQTTPHQAAASFDRLPFVPGRDPATTVMGLVDQRTTATAARSRSAGTSRTRCGHQGVAGVGDHAAGSCGNGVCEIGERAAGSWRSPSSRAPRAAEWAVHSQSTRTTTSGTAWSWRRRRPSSAGASRGRSRRRERRSAAPRTARSS